MKFKEKLLSTRIEGEKMRNSVMNYLKFNSQISLDMSEVETISPSFSDELFGKLAINELGVNDFIKRIKITNARDEVKSAILFGISTRKALENQKRENNKPTAEE